MSFETCEAEGMGEVSVDRDCCGRVRVKRMCVGVITRWPRCESQEPRKWRMSSLWRDGARVGWCGLVAEGCLTVFVVALGSSRGEFSTSMLNMRSFAFWASSCKPLKASSARHGLVYSGTPYKVKMTILPLVGTS